MQLHSCGVGSAGLTSISFHQYIYIRSESMSEIEFFPAMHNRRIIDFTDSQQDSFFKFLFRIHPNVLQEGSGHFTEERFDKI